MGNFRNIVGIGHADIKHVAQTGSSISNAMSQMQPAFICSDRMRAKAVFHFVNGVVCFLVDNDLFGNLCIFNRFRQPPANTATFTRVDKTILRTGEEGVFSIDKLFEKHNIALLSSVRNQIGKAFPVYKVFCTCNTGSGSCARSVAFGGIGIFAFGAEHAVNPAIFVSCKTHIVDVGIGFIGLRQGYWAIPETEIIDTIRTFGNGKERFTIGSLNPHNQQVFAVPLNSSRVECGVNTNAFHKKRVRFGIQVETPVQWSMVAG